MFVIIDPDPGDPDDRRWGRGAHLLSVLRDRPDDGSGEPLRGYRQGHGGRDPEPDQQHPRKRGQHLPRFREMGARRDGHRRGRRLPGRELFDPDAGQHAGLHGHGREAGTDRARLLRRPRRQELLPGGDHGRHRPGPGLGPARTPDGADRGAGKTAGARLFTGL